MAAKRKVLFLCTGNSCRSQMAEGLLRARAANRFNVFSAGTDPHGLNPGAITAMATIGIDISKQTSRHVDEFLSSEIDTVITVCDNAKEACPVFPGGVDTLHWSFDDPADATGNDDERAAVFERVRNEIDLEIRSWLDRGI